MIQAPEINIGTFHIQDEENINVISIGIIAINARKLDPKKVSLLDTPAKYSVVCVPGLIPGIYPPLFCMFSATCLGSKVIEI